MTSTAVSTGFSLPNGASSISSVDYAGAMLPWAMIQEFKFKVVGVVVLTVITLLLALWNRRKILQEARELAQAQQAETHVENAS
ncbi:hypothetical protein [Sodalis sp. (in: enterobacteria)]|uniref:hypothetical protein n=1 Tax=Sodalis sp. (in: enterobacteria) TaxID=1898979 RepID=UPI003F38B890